MIIYLVILFLLFAINEKFFDKKKNTIIFIAVSFLSPMMFFVDLSLGLPILQNSTFEKIAVVSFLVLNSAYLLYQIFEKNDVVLKLSKYYVLTLSLFLLNNIYLKVFIILYLLFRVDVIDTQKELRITKRLIAYLSLFSFLITGPSTIKLYAVLGVVVFISADFMCRKKTLHNILLFFACLDIVNIDHMIGDYFLYSLLSLVIIFSIGDNIQELHKEKIWQLVKKAKPVERIIYNIVMKYRKVILLNTSVVPVTSEKKPLPIENKQLEHTMDKNLTYIFVLLLLLTVFALGAIK